MLGDTMAYGRQVTGIPREGAMSSVIAVIEKTSAALGVGVVGAILKVNHYLPTTGGHLVTQPTSAVNALYAGYAVIPAAMFAINAVFMMFYDLDESRMRAPVLADA